MQLDLNPNMMLFTQNGLMDGNLLKMLISLQEMQQIKNMVVLFSLIFLLLNMQRLPSMVILTRQMQIKLKWQQTTPKHQEMHGCTLMVI